MKEDFFKLCNCIQAVLMSERNFILNEEIVFWIKRLSNKIKSKEIQGAMDLGVGINAPVGEF